VVSRTTARRYADTRKSAAEIGRELDVQYLLEGSVRWARLPDGSSRVRVTPQLIRVADDSHVWADSLDRELDDVFVLQAEIAERVADELGVSLLERERQAVRRRPTENLEAYQAYLRGRWHQSRPHFTLDHWQAQLEAYERAVALDPDFALAHAAIAETHSELRYYGFDLSRRRVEMARAAADRAMSLDPEDPRVHHMLAYYFLWGERDADRALEEIETARRGLGTTVGVIQAEIYVRSMQGRFGDAVRLADEGMKLDGQNPSLPTQAIFDAWFLRDYPRAVRYADRAFELAPASMWPMLGKTFVHWSWNGDTGSSRRALGSSARDFGDWTTWTWYWQEIFEGQLEEALQRIDAYGPDWIETKIVHRPRPFMRATVLEIMGRPVQAREQWSEALVMIGDAVREEPDNHLAHATLGVTLAALGDRERAVAEGQHAMELLPVTRDAFYGVTCEVDMARIYALLGDSDSVFDQLDRLLTIPSWISVPWIEMDPTFDSLRDHPRYAEILAAHRAD
jgi:tetratricopeptide (TPR) repeat protein